MAYAVSQKSDGQWGQFWLQGDVWECLETFLVVTTWDMLLVPSGSGQGCC